MLSLKKKFVGSRAPRRLRSAEDLTGVTASKKGQIILEGPAAELKLPEEALMEYLEVVAQRAGGGLDLRDHLTRTFTDLYGPEGLRPVMAPGTYWADPISITHELASKTGGSNILLGANRKHLSQAKALQDWIKRVTTYKTAAENAFDNLLDATTAHLAGKPGWKTASLVMDHMPLGS